MSVCVCVCLCVCVSVCVCETHVKVICILSKGLPGGVPLGAVQGDKHVCISGVRGVAARDNGHVVALDLLAGVQAELGWRLLCRGGRVLLGAGVVAEWRKLGWAAAVVLCLLLVLEVAEVCGQLTPELCRGCASNGARGEVGQGLETTSGHGDILPTLPQIIHRLDPAPIHIKHLRAAKK